MSTPSYIYISFILHTHYTHFLTIYLRQLSFFSPPRFAPRSPMRPLADHRASPPDRRAYGDAYVVEPCRPPQKKAYPFPPDFGDSSPIAIAAAVAVDYDRRSRPAPRSAGRRRIPPPAAAAAVSRLRMSLRPRRRRRDGSQAREDGPREGDGERPPGRGTLPPSSSSAASSSRGGLGESDRCRRRREGNMMSAK